MNTARFVRRPLDALLGWQRRYGDIARTRDTRGRSGGGMTVCVPDPSILRLSPTAVVEAIYEAINRRDYEQGFALLADDFEWLEPEQALLGGRHTGKGEVREALERQIEVFDEFAIEPEEFHEHGDHVAVPIRQRARGGVSGIVVEIRIGHLWTVRNRKAVRLEVFPAREDARRAAEAPERS